MKYFKGPFPWHGPSNPISPDRSKRYIRVQCRECKEWMLVIPSNDPRDKYECAGCAHPKGLEGIGGEWEPDDSRYHGQTLFAEDTRRRIERAEEDRPDAENLT